ncbi:hypothetical protein HYFRA_00012666 [Hymenoscyphus fraxineus]|uniref:Uncharacterized protein n=1 Tax=Hymenoscyphus fraxineus TaxID=746836 RepID=A0A9N9L6D6_9HELO|nr:hypothetical protein HYFRA_00012666 [Hymenoscyphus fraxineus]
MLLRAGTPDALIPKERSESRTRSATTSKAEEGNQRSPSRSNQQHILSLNAIKDNPPEKAAPTLLSVATSNRQNKSPKPAKTIRPKQINAKQHDVHTTSGTSDQPSEKNKLPAAENLREDLAHICQTFGHIGPSA